MASREGGTGPPGACGIMLASVCATDHAGQGGGAGRCRNGDRAERTVVRALQDHGLAGERVPLSGAARGRFGGDLSVSLLGRDRRIEVKARSKGFRRLYDWLGDLDFLVLKADRREPLVDLPLSLAVEIAAIAERARP